MYIDFDDLMHVRILETLTWINKLLLLLLLLIKRHYIRRDFHIPLEIPFSTLYFQCVYAKFSCL